MLRRCRALIRDPDEAQDVAQEVFLAIMQKSDQIRDPERLASWVYRLATHHCLNHLRANRRRTARETADTVAAWQDRPPPGPDAQYSLKDLLAQMTTSLDELGQQIFVYRYLDGMTQEEIAAMTQRSRRTVGKRLTKIAARVADFKGELR